MIKTTMQAGLVLATTVLAGCDKKAEPVAQAPVAEAATTEMVPADSMAAPADPMAPSADPMAPSADAMAAPAANDASGPPPADGTEDRGNDINR